jgi:TetR/AcrR family transcriptional repressor of mexJK operon
MPARDEQDFERKRQQIIDGALQVFATKGYEKATNKDIAGAAGIHSPGLIYHYFRDKADLFRRVLEQRAPALELLSRGEALMDKPPREVLTLFGRAMLSMADNRTTLAVLKIMLSEAMRRPVVAEVFANIGPRPGFAFMTRYLERQMDAGTLRRMDAGAAMRCVMGPLIAYLLTREVFALPDARTLEWETMLDTFVEILLGGMLDEGEK